MASSKLLFFFNYKFACISRLPIPEQRNPLTIYYAPCGFGCLPPYAPAADLTRFAERPPLASRAARAAQTLVIAGLLLWYSVVLWGVGARVN